ncbi:MAG: hypothetical protein K9L17_07215 [Clostridiales bacterium]|nr:hypothetical protein [Clostridiales bacterium]
MQRFLSTLIVQFAGVKNLEDEEKAIQALLLSLVFNGGNWPLEELQEINHVRLRHTSCKPHRWAERVYNGMYWSWTH